MGLLDKLRSKKKVAVIGIDGVPYGLLEQGMEEGWLENLASLETFQQMDAALPVVSSVCWPCATTGLNPGETGVFGFLEREEGSDDTYVPMGSHVDGDRVWDVVGDAGRSSLVLNVPVTFPPSEIKGKQVSGFLSPDVERAAGSSGLTEKLKSMDYRVDTDVSLHDDREKLIQNIHDTLDARLEAFSTLADEEKWDLFFGVVMETDRLNHFFWKDYAEEGEYYDEFVEVFKKIDEFIGEFRESLPKDTELVVMSDHGFTDLEKEFDLNAFLEEEGFIETRGDDSNSLKDVESEAYSLLPGRVYVDLESRRPGGSVPEEDYEEVRERVVESLKGAEDPETGEKVVDEVFTKEELYEGQYEGRAPDVVVHPVDGYDLKASLEDGSEMVKLGPRNGMHTLNDASLLSTAELSGEAAVWDVAPTILDLMDIEDGEMDGSSLAG